MEAVSARKHQVRSVRLDHLGQNLAAPFTQPLVGWRGGEEKDLWVVLQLPQDLEPVLDLPSGIAEPFQLLALVVGIVHYLAPHPGEEQLVSRSQGEGAVYPVHGREDHLSVVRLPQVLAERGVPRPRNVEGRYVRPANRPEDRRVFADLSFGAEVTQQG